jgi:hypothetical protein
MPCSKVSQSYPIGIGFLAQPEKYINKALLSPELQEGRKQQHQQQATY